MELSCELDSKVQALERQVEAARVENLNPHSRHNTAVFREFNPDHVLNSAVFKKYQRSQSTSLPGPQAVPVESYHERRSSGYPVYSLHYSQFESQLAAFQQHLQTQLEQVRRDLAEDLINKDIELRTLKREAQSYKTKNQALKGRCETLEDTVRELQLELEALQAAEEASVLKVVSAKLRADQEAAGYEIERLQKGLAYYQAKIRQLEAELQARELKCLSFHS